MTTADICLSISSIQSDENGRKTRENYNSILRVTDWIDVAKCLTKILIQQLRAFETSFLLRKIFSENSSTKIVHILFPMFSHLFEKKLSWKVGKVPFIEFTKADRPRRLHKLDITSNIGYVVMHKIKYFEIQTISISRWNTL